MKRNDLFLEISIMTCLTHLHFQRTLFLILLVEHSHEVGKEIFNQCLVHEE